ncbi:hypothetical protein [Sphingomonas sp. 22176]|uniref:hypothetical protein n=1 Tax=Sphingomonas sp. 22176 TaxID=3453884 RepID=UPI003F8612D8
MINTRSIILGVTTALGLVGVVNGTFMLRDPMYWYFAVPGDASTGAFNQHFVHDDGLIFLLVGAVLLIGVLRQPVPTALWSTAALWLRGHAMSQLREVAVGNCGPGAIGRNFPAVPLPAILTAALAGWASCDARVNGRRAIA